MTWTAESWQNMPVCAQAVEYEDNDTLNKILQQIKSFPPMVDTDQIDVARARFADAAIGKAFIIQGGDCAENFDDVQYEIVASKVSLLQQQADILESSLRVPVITVGRIAGQYAKPRSSPFEKLPDGSQIHAFRGHNVNGPSLSERKPDPNRLLLGHFHSATSMRALDIMQQKSNDGSRTPSLSGSSSGTSTPGQLDSGRVLIDGTPSWSRPSQIYTSHEGLHLPYETAVTKGRYNTSATMIWVGERTRQLDGAHLEYVRGLENPIGVKFGPTATPEEIISVLDAICPNKETSVGKVTLITRMGAKKVESVLPTLIKGVQKSGHQPVWMCDPCHGNTQSAGGYKTRTTADILHEINTSYRIHKELGSHLGGIHLEQTGEHVTECVDSLDNGNEHLTLGQCYRTLCDPRLSRNQALGVIQKFGDQAMSNTGLPQLALGDKLLLQKALETVLDDETTSRMAVAA